jgi:glycosyltransferase involved in cell wall biosynthesis
MINIALDARPIIHNEKSGVWVYTERLIEYLSKIDSNNSYHLLFSGIKLKEDDIPLNINGNFKKVILPIPDRNFYKKQLLWNNIMLPMFFKKKKVDVFHMPAGHDLSKYKHVKKVITIHDLRSFHIDDVLKQDFNRLKNSCENADVVITVSEHTRQDLIKNLRIPENKIKTVHPGVVSVFNDVKNDAVSIDELKARYDLDKPFFFSLGLMPRKNIKRLLEAYSKFKYKDDFLLVLAGPGSHGPWFEEYKELIKEKEMSGNVRLYGPVPQDDLMVFYKTAFCFIFPSLYEGFGMPILEAMASGAPVISSNAAALPEVGADAAFYVDPYKTDEIASAMETMAEDTECREKFIQKGLQRASQFNWEKMAKDVLTTYQSS